MKKYEKKEAYAHKISNIGIPILTNPGTSYSIRPHCLIFVFVFLLNGCNKGFYFLYISLLTLNNLIRYHTNTK